MLRTRIVKNSATRSKARSSAHLERLEDRQLFAGISFHVYPQIGQNTSFVQNLAAGPDGNVWFSSGLNHQVGYTTPGGSVKIYDTAGVSSHGPSGLTAGPDGNMWFDEHFDQVVGKVNLATGVVSKLPITGSFLSPDSMTLGPDGNFWMASFFNKIERFTPSGALTVYAHSGNNLGQIVSFNGQLYFGEGNKIGRITTGGVFGSEFATPSGGDVQRVGVGPDGNLWFTEKRKTDSDANNFFGYVTKAGVVKEFAVSKTYGDVGGIAGGADGNVYFRAGDYLFGVGPATGAIFATQNLGASAGTSGQDLIQGPDGNLWFNEGFNDKLGVAYVAGTLTGTAFVDVNGNHVRDASETGLANVTVYLDLAHKGTYVAGDPVATTNAAGVYRFNEKPGAYTVGVIAPSGYQATTATSVALNATLGGYAYANFGLQKTAGAPVVGLSAIDTSAAEGRYGSPASAGLIALNREAGGTGAVTVNLTVAGTATYGTDYTIAVYGGTFAYNATTHTLSVTLAAGAQGAGIVVTPLNDNVTEPAETISLTLLTSTAYQTDAAKLNAVVTIAAG